MDPIKKHEPYKWFIPYTVSRYRSLLLPLLQLPDAIPYACCYQQAKPSIYWYIIPNAAIVINGQCLEAKCNGEQYDQEGNPISLFHVV